MKLFKLGLLAIGLLSSNLALAETKQANLSRHHPLVQEVLNKSDTLVIHYNLKRAPRRYLYYYAVQCTTPTTNNITLSYPWHAVTQQTKLPAELHGFPADDANIDGEGVLTLKLVSDFNAATVQCSLQEVVIPT